VGRKGLVIAIVIAAAVAIGLAVALFQPRQPTPEDGGTIIANNTEPVPEEIVSIASARSAFPFVQRWVSQYNNDENNSGNIEIGYYLDEPNSPTDAMIVGDIRHTLNGSQNIPVSAQAVAVVYNIPSFPDIPSGMKLNSSLLASIFNGNITRWNDPAIKNASGDLNLPAERISVVHERGNSSSLTLLQDYLSTDIQWPANSVSVLGPDELAATVRKTPYSIGYVDFSYATQTRMTFASIENTAGKYVLPSTDSIYQAVNGSMQLQNASLSNQTDDLATPTIGKNINGNSSYPITGLYYASLPNNPSNATLAFVQWIIDEEKGQQALSEVQYPAMYQGSNRLDTYAEALLNSTNPRVAKS
jgi:ABC-type phosphate transport system substrate-binding protein